MKCIVGCATERKLIIQLLGSLLQVFTIPEGNCHHSGAEAALPMRRKRVMPTHTLMARKTYSTGPRQASCMPSFRSAREAIRRKASPDINQRPTFSRAFV